MKPPNNAAVSASSGSSGSGSKTASQKRSTAMPSPPTSSDEPSSNSFRLTPLRTKAEVEAANDLVEVYITRIPRAAAHNLLDLLKEIIPPEATSKFQHLRRIAKPDFVPEHLRDDPTQRRANYKGPLSYLLLCTTSSVERIKLHEVLGSSAGAALFRPLVPCIRAIPVPNQAPMSSTMAEEWSRLYWPTVYKNTNPYGPHPAIVRRAELEILGTGLDGHNSEGGIEAWMKLAREAAALCKSTGQGCGAGAIVIDRVTAPEGTTGGSKEARTVVVAGDARFCGLTHGVKGDSNVLGHAVMRAIALVARKRRMVSSRRRPSLESMVTDNTKVGDPSQPQDFYLDKPLNALEKHHLEQPTLAADGYLCVDLELYLTHEPCVMCSMALLHSRFCRVVVDHPVPQTGAILAENLNKDQETKGLNYGLFWRPELNWRCLAWKWDDKPQPEKPTQQTKLPTRTAALPTVLSGTHY